MEKTWLRVRDDIENEMEIVIDVQKIVVVHDLV
jgi:hypothetical protein